MSPRILLINDDPVDRTQILCELNRVFPGSQVCQCVDQCDLDAALEKREFDLVVTDFQNGCANLHDLLQVIKRRVPDCPVILYSGTESENVVFEELHTLRDCVRGLEQPTLSSSHEFPLVSLKDFVTTAPIGLCLLDTDLRFVYINEWLAAINGLSVEEHLGRRIREVLPHVAAGVESQLRHVLETGEPILEGSVEAETPAHPHGQRHFQHNYSAVRSNDSTVIGVSCVVQDITERKQADEDLRLTQFALDRAADSMDPPCSARLAAAVPATLEKTSLNRRMAELEARHESLLNRLNVGVFRCTAEGRLLYANSACASLLGFKSLVPAEQHEWLESFFKSAAWGQILDRLLKTGRPRDAAVQWRRPDGSIICVRLNETRPTTADGETILEGLVENVTNGNRAQDDQQQRAAAAQLSLLSPREGDVLNLVADGKTNKMVAEQLGISTKTVEMHRGKLMKKLRVDNVATLVRLVIAAESLPTS